MKSLDDFHFLRLGADTLQNPYPFFARLRSEAPVYREPDYGVLLVSRYDDVVAASQSTDAFSSIVTTTGPFIEPRVPLDDLDRHRREDADADKLFRNDPPGHTRYRRLVAPLFAAKRVAAMEGRIREHVTALIEPFCNAGELEFVSHIANVLPMIVVGELLGVGREDNAYFGRLFAKHFAEMQSFVGKPDAPTVKAPDAEVLSAYFRKEIKSRCSNPRDDIMSVLAAAITDPIEPISFDDVINLCVFLYSAGGESNTPQLLTTGTKVLAEHPEIYGELKRNPALIAGFIDEALRFETPALGLFRIAREATEIAGTHVAQGDMAFLLYASANRDEAHFPQGDEFRLHRPKRRVLSFGGFGPHTCPGAALARLEAKVLFEELLKRFGSLRISPSQGPFQYLETVILRSVRELKVEGEIA